MALAGSLHFLVMKLIIQPVIPDWFSVGAWPAVLCGPSIAMYSFPGFALIKICRFPPC
ncbi:hypothetical protein D3C73_943820 [compost metagenome]